MMMLIFFKKAILHWIKSNTSNHNIIIIYLHILFVQFLFIGSWFNGLLSARYIAYILFQKIYPLFIWIEMEIANLLGIAFGLTIIRNLHIVKSFLYTNYFSLPALTLQFKRIDFMIKIFETNYLINRNDFQLDIINAFKTLIFFVWNLSGFFNNGLSNKSICYSLTNLLILHLYFK
jgi:hypothetical protein